MSTRDWVQIAASVVYVVLGAAVVTTAVSLYDSVYFAPYASLIVVAIYLIGAGFLVGLARAGRSWLMLLVPVAVVPAVLCGLILMIVFTLAFGFVFG